MDEELRTDAIGIPPRSDQRDDSGVDETSNTPDPSASQNTLQTHGTGCPQTNTQSKSKKLEKPLQSENTNTIQNEHNLDPSNNDRPTMSNEYVVNAETTAPKTKSPLPDKVMVTHDKDELNIASSIPTLPREPPLEWRLNDFLHDIAQEIEKSDFEKIKLLFTGPDSLGEDLLNECDTCIKLFTVLKEKRYISKDNILYLNKILYNLGRRDLIERCVRYCHEEGNVIHYYSFEGARESGTRYVKIHVVADTQNYSKETLEQLRYRIASIICAPIEVVKIYAIEPGSSLLITFAMPDIYVDVLKGLLQGKVNLWRLSSLQVDIVIVDDIRYDVSGLSSDKMVSEQYKEIRNVYEQLNDKRKELEQLEITHLTRLEELKDLKIHLERTEKVNHELTATCYMLQEMHLTSHVNDAVLESFQSLIREASDKKQDMGLIQKIIKSNTEINAAYHRRLSEMQREGQILKLKERKMKDEMLLRELSLNVKSAEDILLTKYEENTLDFKFNLNVDVTKTLRGVSEMIKDEVGDKLMYRIAWSQDDVIKACIEADKGLLILGLECKQTEKTQNRVNTGKFLTQIGEEIGKDLLKMYNQIAAQQMERDKEEQRRELNVQLLKQLTSKSPKEIILSYAKSLNFGCILNSEKMLVSIPAVFVEHMAQKGRGLILFLNEVECTKLSSFCTWYDQDVIKECIKEDRNLLLPGVLCKEMERVGETITPEAVIIRLQEETNRKDLLGLFGQFKTDEKQIHAQIDLWQERQKKESQLLQLLLSEQTSAEDVLRRKFKKFTLKLADDIETKPAFDKLTKLLGDLSGKVKEKENIQLIEQYKWDKNDIIKACISADKRLLFESLWYKEMDITQSIPEIGRFLLRICQKINRTDLFEQFIEDMKILSFDEKLLHHVIDKTAEYFSNAPRVQNMLNNTQTMTNEGGATSIPEYSKSLIEKAASTSSEYLPM